MRILLFCFSLSVVIMIWIRCCQNEGGAIMIIIIMIIIISFRKILAQNKTELEINESNYECLLKVERHSITPYEIKVKRNILELKRNRWNFMKVIIICNIHNLPGFFFNWKKRIKNLMVIRHTLHSTSGVSSQRFIGENIWRDIIKKNKHTLKLNPTQLNQTFVTHSCLFFFIMQLNHHIITKPS